MELVTRPPRRAAPALPSGEIALEAPPALPTRTAGRWRQWLSLLPMLAGTVATALMFGGRDGASTYTYVVGAIFGLSMLGMVVTNWGGAQGPRTSELTQARRDYLRYLSGLRRRVRSVVADQRAAMHYRHPDPGTLWSLASGPRIWERRPGDGDFAVVRVGVGPQDLATALLAPSLDPAADPDPVTAGALHRFLDTYAVVPDLPVSAALAAFARIVIVDDRHARSAGDSSAARALARAMLAQLATFHAPADLIIASCVAAAHRRDWDWLKWLPHCGHPTATDAIGPRRLVATNMAELDDLLAGLVDRGSGSAAPRSAAPRSATARSAAPPAVPGAEPSPHLVVVIDDPDQVSEPAAAGSAGVTLVTVAASPPRTVDRTSLVLTIAATTTRRGDPDGVTLRSTTADGVTDIGRPDALSRAEAEALARQLAPLRLSGAVRDQSGALVADHDLAGLLRIPDLRTADIGTLWAPRPPRDMLRVPIGTTSAGEVVELDLKEAAQYGMGPHGLIVGATGSGKSELLRTIVLALAATHPPEVLNVVLVDFKGGATFATLDRLPHTSALITNLADELPLVDRMNDAMSGELVRRQELLRRSGNFASLRDYHQARADGADLPPLPSLLLVCDEFTEMLTAKPDFIDLFLQIGRIGRSIGVHLLLATQRLEEGRLRGLESNLSYRIALRTFTSGESRMVLGSTDAAELPSAPGHAFLKVGTEAPTRFKAAFVSGPYRRAGAQPDAPSPRILDFSVQAVPDLPAAGAVAGPSGAAAGPSLMQVVVDSVTGHGAAAHRVWLPPLAQPATVDALLGELATDPVRGLTTAERSVHGALRVPIAEVDKPFEQCRGVAWLELSGSTGHVAIVGGPQSGKSTALRSLIATLALTHTPREVQVYCLDFGGGSLRAMRQLPHVGGVAGRVDAAAVRRTVGEIAALLDDRERLFAERGIDSMADFRRTRRPTDLAATVVAPEDGFGDVFLVIDGWGTLRGDFDDLEPVVVDIATRGLSYGIHVVATAVRWNDFRLTIKDLFATRVELRLGDPAESSVNRRAAANVPLGQPGHGLTPDGLHVLTALPRTVGYDPTALITAIAAAWNGPPAPPVRMLPALLPYTQLLAPTEDGDRLPAGTGLTLPLGIAESDLRLVLLDFAADPHLIAFGDSECGKTALLRTIGESIIRRFRPEQARIVIIDYRRSLLGTVHTDHLIGYGTAPENALPLIESVASYLDQRRPGADVTPEQLRARSWWSGPECFVLVDDYDLVAAGSANPLLPLLDYLAQARDVGLHVIVTRRAGGAGRALYEPVLQRLRELGSPALVMAGSRDEGPLAGSVRPGPQPPGRGWLVTHKEGARLVQIAYVEPSP